MILHSRWRILGGWFTVVLLFSVVLLTMCRSMLIVVGLIALLQPALSKGRGLGRVMLFGALMAIGASYGLDHLPGAERIQKRLESVSDMQSDGSMQARLQILTDGVPWIVNHPFGLGLGSSGIGAGRM